MSGKTEEFGCSGQVGLRPQDVVMPHIGGKPREPGLQVDALPRPSSKPMDRKGVPQIIGPRSDAASVGFQSCLLEQSSEGFPCSLDWQPLLMDSYKKAIVRLGRSEGTPSREILVQLLC
jgi:hypothetical protein